MREVILTVLFAGKRKQIIVTVENPHDFSSIVRAKDKECAPHAAQLLSYEIK